MTPPYSLDQKALLDQFRASFSSHNPLAAVGDGLVGQDAVFDGPFGTKTLLYADYVASGRALKQVEDFVATSVLPFYANTHTEGSFCGSYMTRLRQCARETIARLCGADDRYAVIFAGSGATAGLNRLAALLGAAQESRPSRGWGRVAAMMRAASGPKTRVIIGPYEHHSNILPWRESGAEVVEIGEAAGGGPDLVELQRALAGARRGERTICAFSAASNITGITTDVVVVTRLAKAAGALVVWDYAGGGPYLPINMTPAPGVEIDAVVVSPHKFVGGPGASGVFIVRRDAVVTTRPVMPGGGTVKFVSSTVHDYLDGLEDREEAGTPNGIGDIRAALAFLVKDAVPARRLAARNAELASRAIAAWSDVEGLQLLGPLDAPRLPIFSFLIHDGQAGYVHPQLVTRILSDRFGIQVRGGCACAGPYAHRLLSISPEASARLRREILAGDNSNKPGFTRLNLSAFMSDEKVRFIVETVAALPAVIAQLRDSYAFDARLELFEPRVEQPDAVD